MLLVDTNILARLQDAASPEHANCARAIALPLPDADQLVICAQVLMEFWVVATRPRDVHGLGMAPNAADAALDDFEQMFPVIPDPHDLLPRWRRLVRQHDVRGRPAHDTRLVALMQAYDIKRILTLNIGDFKRYPDIQAITPAQLLACG